MPSTASSAAGRLFARITVLPAAVVAAWLLVAFPLLLADRFAPLPAVLLGVPAVAAAGYAVWRWTPAPPERDPPRWPLAAVLLIAAAFTAVQLAHHAETLVIRRDPASYAQYTVWIARHGGLPIPQHRELIAGDLPGLGFESLAYYEVGDVIWPQFLAGAPLVFSIGFWLGGPGGMVLVPPVVGGLAVLVFAGLAGRLIGTRWAPAAALVLAAALPVQWAARSTYSEPVGQVLLLGGLALAFDALSRRTGLRDRWGVPHALAGAAGLAFGLGLVVRIDALRDLLPVVGFLGLLLLARRGQAVPMALGLAAGLGYGLVAAFGLSRPYLEHLSDSLNPLLVLCGGVLAATAALTAALWRRGVPRTDRSRWLPAAGFVLVLLLMLGFAVRPLVLPEYGHGDQATADFVGQVQALEGAPVDPDRNYGDQSLYWVVWYLGLTAVAAASVGAALLVRRILLRRDPQWVLPMMVLAWSVATTLARPAITPDHPWASRRLVVLVLPAFVLLAIWLLAWAARRIRELDPAGARSRLGAAVVAAGVAAAAVPTAAASAGIMGYRGDAGSVAAAERLCATIPDDASVILVDGVGHYYGQLIRGMCDVPTAAADGPDTVARAVEGIRERGRTPVLAANEREPLEYYAPSGDRIEHPFHVRAEQDPSTLTRPPSGAWPFEGDVWVLVLPGRQ
ncbi:hypothetical protein [Nocardiopsis composta]|uniref:Glycosyltransferase RgtA/B/C/D-like domain-containing protein n=1 Tax=Nocardiopsis composta TaxID=157465 RepID=A0A7W8QLY7_9ACTN|nr:hypothetical protein [Nocardiopsis composta]MBB5432892.1 hypothetical protein [Nocardiopsis composta]